MSRSPLASKQLVWDAVGYTPTAAALAAHACDARFILVAGGARGSKSLSAAFEGLPHACLPKQLGWLVGPDYEQARPEFNYILNGLVKLGLVTKVSQPREGSAAVTTTYGSEIVTKTADDPLKLAARAPDFIILCEAAQCSYDVYLRCLERLAEKRGWLWMCGTFEGSYGWYPELYKRWQTDNAEGGRSFSLPTWSNERLFPLGENDPEIIRLRNTVPRDVFLERYGGVPCPPSNLVFKEFSYARHVSDGIAFDPTEPVEVWVDPGYSGSRYAVEFVQLMPRYKTRQALGRFAPPANAGSASATALPPEIPMMDVWCVDEIYADHATTFDVIRAAKGMPLWRAVRGGVGDIAVRQHGGLPSHYEVWVQSAGIWLRGRRIAVEANVERHHSFLMDPGTDAPRLFFNPKCKGAFAEYGAWKRKEIGENVYGEPEKVNCDALKAIGYGLIDHFGSVEPVFGPVVETKWPGNPFAMRLGT